MFFNNPTKSKGKALISSCMLIKELVETAPLMTMEENKYKKINLAKDLLGEKDILKHLK